MAGRYQDGAVVLAPGVSLAVGKRPGRADGTEVSVSIRPEKLWLSDHEPSMATCPGVLKETIYAGATTSYLVELAPDRTVTVLEQNTDRSRREERWANGEKLTVGFRPEHCLLLD